MQLIVEKLPEETSIIINDQKYIKNVIKLPFSYTIRASSKPTLKKVLPGWMIATSSTYIW